MSEIKTPKIAPVQGYAQGIPWEMHMRAYNVYCSKYSPQPALIEGWCRGGFSTGELDMFIPGWRDELEELPRLRRELIQAQQTLAQKDGEIQYLRDALKEVGRLNNTSEMLNVSMAMMATEQVAKKALIYSAPAPVAVVPWEVVKESIEAEWSIQYLIGEELKEGLKRRESARAKLQSYAPKKDPQ